VKFSAALRAGEANCFDPQSNDAGSATRTQHATSMQDFRKILVWQANRELTVSIYKATANFPAEERYGLVSQMRRAVVSIGSGIAEGCGRGSIADSLRFYQMSFSSSMELLHQLITWNDLGYLPNDRFRELDTKLGRNSEDACELHEETPGWLTKASRSRLHRRAQRAAEN
jgi:four helix bundle protein